MTQDQMAAVPEAVGKRVDAHQDRPRPNARGRASRRAVLDHAARLATVEGLERLSIGMLAADLGMSKSGLFALFRSKTELQLATLRHSREMFRAEVEPALSRAPAGCPRAWAAVEAWMDYELRGVFPGGCFLSAASAEFDSRPGPVRDLLQEFAREWLAELAELVRGDIEDHLLGDDLEPDQAAFGLRAVFLMTNWHWKLLDDEAAFDRGRELAARVLGLSGYGPDRAGMVGTRRVDASS
ncbi:MAG: TetR/AcrR family transcriptional regulator [Dermatophilaceae bacterium]